MATSSRALKGFPLKGFNILSNVSTLFVVISLNLVILRFLSNVCSASTMDMSFLFWYMTYFTRTITICVNWSWVTQQNNSHSAILKRQSWKVLTNPQFLSIVLAHSHIAGICSMVLSDLYKIGPFSFQIGHYG